MKQQQKIFKATCSCVVQLWWEQFYWLRGIWFTPSISSSFSQYNFNEIASLASFQNSHLHLKLEYHSNEPDPFYLASVHPVTTEVAPALICHAQWLEKDLKV